MDSGKKMPGEDLLSIGKFENNKDLYIRITNSSENSYSEPKKGEIVRIVRNTDFHNSAYTIRYIIYRLGKNKDKIYTTARNVNNNFVPLTELSLALFR